MAASANSGPWFIWGNLTQLLSSVFGTNSAVPDPNADAGPSAVYQGWAMLDPRTPYLKDKVTGYTGVVQSHLDLPTFKSAGQIPAALASNNIAAGQNVVSGTSMTLAAASVGVVLNVPIIPFSGSLNGAPAVNAAIALDFGFGFGSCVAGSATIQVADSTQFSLGMPLVIGGVGNSGGTTSLLTNVLSIVDGTHITVIPNAIPAATNAAAPIGTGNLWGPNSNGFPLPTAAFPFVAGGPALMLDTRQSISRGIQIVGVSGGAGGTFLVSGWDVYGQAMTQLVTVAAGASTGYSLKTFKYIASVVPQFTDAHNYTVGTADLFGFNYRSGLWEDTNVFWAGVPMATSTGWIKFDAATPTNATGDVRGTIQTGTAGPGSGIGSTASNGSVVGLTMSGNRLEMTQDINVTAILRATQANATTLFGQIQA